MGSVTNEAELGKKLQLARKRAGLTQQELCQKAGLSYSTLAKIERGAIRSPSVFTVASIAAVTGAPLEELLDMAAKKANSPTPAETKKRSKTGVRFVYFDVNHVLVSRFEHAFTDAARELGISADVVENLFWRHSDSVCRGQMSMEKYNAVTAKELGISRFDWHDYYMRNIKTMPGMAELVKWVGEHFEIGIISNHMPGFIDELIDKKIIPEADYKAVVDSCRVGAIKPEPKIYKVAQELADMEPNEILLVDDTRPFLTAADQAGWQILWFDELDPSESIGRIKKHLEL